MGDRTKRSRQLCYQRLSFAIGKRCAALFIERKATNYHCLARGLKQKIEPELQRSFDEGLLLSITPFEKKVIRVIEKTAAVRNKMMIEMADKIVIGHVSEKGNLVKQLENVGKEIIYLE